MAAKKEPGLLIKARSGSIRRCGHRFNEDGKTVALSSLKKGEADRLKADKDLLVSEAEVDSQGE